MKHFRILDTTTAHETALAPIGKEYPTWFLWPAGRDRVSDAIAAGYGKTTYWQTAVIASRLLPPDEPSVCVDVGANLGAFTVPIAKMRPHCMVYAFEPGSVPFLHLSTHLFLNGLSNVRAERLALAKADGILPLYLPDPLDLGSATLRPYAPRAEMIEVVVARALDEHYLGGSAIHLMKIHVSGGEAGVIEGAKETIKQHGTPLLLEIPDPKIHGRVAERYQADAFHAVHTVLGYEIAELFPEHYLAGPAKRFRSLLRRSRE